MKNQDKKTHIVAITAVVRYGNKFLILKRNPNEIAYPGKWTIPGGKVERGEWIMDVLKREVKEETGLDIEEGIKFLRDYTFIRPDGYNVIGFTFLVSAVNDNVKIDKDFEDFKWVLPEELEGYDCIEGIKEDAQKAFPRYNKLIRDKIPEIIGKNGRLAKTRILDSEEYRQELLNKLIEESEELLRAKDKKEITKEIGDVIEIIDYLIKAFNLDRDEIGKLRQERKESRGGFNKKLFLKHSK